MHGLFPFSSKMWINFWGWQDYFYLLLFFGMFILKSTDYRIFLCSGWKELPLFQTGVCAFFKPIFRSRYHYLRKGSHDEELRKHVAVMVSRPPVLFPRPVGSFQGNPKKQHISHLIAQRSPGHRAQAWAARMCPDPSPRAQLPSYSSKLAYSVFSSRGCEIISS